MLISSNGHETEYEHLFEGVKSLMPGIEGTFRTLFLCLYSPVLPLEVTPDPASLR